MTEITEHLFYCLTDRESLVLKERYVNGLTLREVGKILNVTHERIRQIESKAIRKIRSEHQEEYKKCGVKG